MSTTTTPTIDTGRWPDLATVPTGPRARVSAAIARKLFLVAAHRLGISVTMGRDPGADRGQIHLHRPDEFFARVGSQGLIGFGESYMTGAWDADDLAGTLTVLAREISTLVPGWMQRMRGAYVARPPRAQRNTERNTRRNIAAHYDLSNDLFATFLDPTMSYSSALFDTATAAGEHPGHRRATPPNPNDDLEAGQVRKIDRLLDQARVGPGSRVLEIGTGWGELAIRAAARGATVRSVTLSSEQQELARERIAAAGHADSVTVDLLDYRAVEPEDGVGYDAILSVEMIEAVGHEYWPTFFRKIASLLAPGGVATIQAITMPHD
ncbi:cyclopropane-fatty-acyl-phospholipid synthase family protein, partial [Nocardioides sp.]|uniref:SAM-dependent methyltransferase n=1 Tax=Nocardioides sp. TaxID=35761 RepID=UPI00273356FC